MIERLEILVETDAHEGPVYVGSEDALYFTSLPPETAIKRVQLDTREVTVVRPDANRANGMFLGLDGRLVVCEQGTFDTPAAITLVDRATGATETLVDAPLNSPNDVVVARDGSVWFTDPSYGFLQGFRPAPARPDQVYRHDPATGETRAVAGGFDKPNGIALSPDERTLYVSDNGAPHHLLAFDRVDGTLGEPRVLAVSTPEHPDGLKTDAAGRIYASFAGGVQVYDPAGALVGEIDLPGAVNFAFGRGALFITTDTAIWSAVLKGD